MIKIGKSPGFVWRDFKISQGNTKLVTNCYKAILIDRLSRNHRLIYLLMESWLEVNFFTGREKIECIKHVMMTWEAQKGTENCIKSVEQK